MKKTVVCGPIAALLVLVACDAPMTEATPIAVSTEEAAKQEAMTAELDRINQQEDPAKLHEILVKETMFSDIGKAADKRLAEVLRDDFEEADNLAKLFTLKIYTGVGGSTINAMYDEKKSLLEGKVPG